MSAHTHIIERTVRGEVKLGETVRNAVLYMLEDLTHATITPFSVAFTIGLCECSEHERAYLTNQRRIAGMISLLIRNGRLPLTKVAPNTWKDEELINGYKGSKIKSKEI